MINFNSTGNCSDRAGENFSIQLDQFLASCHVILIVVGFLLNGAVGSLLVIFRRLRKPRNTIWLGVTLCNLFTLLTIAVELWYYYTDSSTACSVFVTVTGLSYSALLYHLFLALVCRYVALSRPLWHRRHVTNRRVGIVQSAGTLGIVLFIEWPHIVRLEPFRCEMLLEQAQRIAAVTFTFVLLIVMGQVAVYLKARKYFAQSSASNDVRGVAEVVRLELDHDQHQTAKSSTVSTSAGVMNMHISRASLSRLEQEATWNLLIGVLPLLVFTSPVLVVGVGERICLMWNDCHTCDVWFNRIQLYARELLLTHTVYQNVIYMVRSCEISQLLREKWLQARSPAAVNRERNDRRREEPLQREQQF